MKIVKESINEIKLNKRGTGLQSVGVGAVTFVDNYVQKEFEKMWESNIAILDYYTAEDGSASTLLIDAKIAPDKGQANMLYDGKQKTIQLTLSNTSWSNVLSKYNYILTKDKPDKKAKYGDNKYSFNAVELYSSGQLSEFFKTINKIIKQEIKNVPVNEIKKGGTDSGLSSIGVGDITVNKAYKHIVKTWPDTYEDSFDTLDMAKHYPKSHVMKHQYIIKEIKNLLHTTEDRILYSVTLSKKLPEIPRWVLQSVSNANDLQTHALHLSATSYVRFRYSESLGVVAASVYGPTRGVSLPTIKKTFCFVRF